jgi:hypothetical protein
VTEQIANAGQTTLNGAISSGATSLVLTDATRFPTTGTFRLIIDSEILAATGIAGTVVTVTRGTEGTTAAAHSDVSVVTAILTAASWTQFKNDVVTDLGAGAPLGIIMALNAHIVPQ